MAATVLTTCWNSFRTSYTVLCNATRPLCPFMPCYYKFLMGQLSRWIVAWTIDDLWKRLASYPGSAELGWQAHYLIDHTYLEDYSWLVSHLHRNAGIHVQFPARETDQKRVGVVTEGVVTQLCELTPPGLESSNPIFHISWFVVKAGVLGWWCTCTYIYISWHGNVVLLCPPQKIIASYTCSTD